MSVRIFTDSTSDLSQQQARQLGVEVIPLTVRFGEEEFVDGVTMTPAEFYNKLEESQQLPQTAQINPDVFEKVFGAAREQGDTLVGIFLSSDLSGTFQSARVAQQMLGEEGFWWTAARLPLVWGCWCGKPRPCGMRGKAPRRSEQRWRSCATRCVCMPLWIH